MLTAVARVARNATVATLCRSRHFYSGVVPASLAPRLARYNELCPLGGETDAGVVSKDAGSDAETCRA